MKYILGALFALLVVYILYDSFSQPTTADLKGNFKEVAMYRNENNTGPVVRIYAVTVQDLPWEEMQKYGDMMPYTKLGTTSVYFFDANQPAPVQVRPGNEIFDIKFKQGCVALYEKDANGQVRFTRTPFKNQ